MSFQASRYFSYFDLFAPGVRQMTFRSSTNATGNTHQRSFREQVNDEEVNLVGGVQALAIAGCIRHEVSDPLSAPAP
jgi:hypothetical protein